MAAVLRAHSRSADWSRQAADAMTKRYQAAEAVKVPAAPWGFQMLMRRPFSRGDECTSGEGSGGEGKGGDGTAARRPRRTSGEGKGKSGEGKGCESAAEASGPLEGGLLESGVRDACMTWRDALVRCVEGALRGGCGGAHFNWLDHLDAVGSGIYRLLDEVSRPRAQDAVSPVGCMLVGRVRARQPDPSLRVCWLGDSDSE